MTNAGLIDAARRWTEAYPRNVFHKPTKHDYKRIAAILKDHGFTLDAISADNMRHVVTSEVFIGLADALEKAEAEVERLKRSYQDLELSRRLDRQAADEAQEKLKRLQAMSK